MARPDDGRGPAGMVGLVICLMMYTVLPLHAQSADSSSFPIPGAEASLEEPGTYPAHAVGDSLARARALLAIARAEVRVAATSFWRRALPGIHFGGSVGLREVVFSDSPGIIALPGDSYRLTVSLSLSDLLDGSKHDLALLEREEARLAYAQLLRKQSTDRALLARKLSAKAQDVLESREELNVIQALVDYYELLFSQGNTEFHTVARARLDLLRAQRGVQILRDECDLIKETFR